MPVNLLFLGTQKPQPMMTLTTQQQQQLDELIALLKIPSISADSNYKVAVAEAADWVCAALASAGCEGTKVIPTAGHPIVYGEKIIDPSLPTVLVYGHYDVQPPDPIELWDSPPFEPVIKTTEIHPHGAIFARGACDDKGQFFMHIKALENMIAHNTLACNVKFMIEGEEEVGSDHLEQFVKENKDQLRADVILISDTGIGNINAPAITTGLRGMSYMEVTVTGPNRDLHSGLYGGTVANPINILCDMISSLHDDQRRITIPGFYDAVVEYTPEERKTIEQAPIDDTAFKKALDLDALMGESGYTTLERKSLRPTLDVNGIWGGYTGEGSKTVIASKAHAKISMRLVPNQDWVAISTLFENHFKMIAPKGVIVSVKTHHGGKPYVTPLNSMGYQAAYKAYEESFGVAPVALRDGGSIPIVPMFEEVLGIKTILMGFGLDSDAIHSPNENYGLVNFFKGIETIPLFYKHFAALFKQGEA
jgi:acetylornithine deacetylase/succinyl-diaminopimelate desuccinylase-like protein